MDIKSLRLFLSLANTLHFGKTSAQMHVSPSTLSRTISRLEEQLGTVLFERDNRTVVLTPAGKQARRHIEVMLSAWQQLQSELQQSAHSLRGQIRLYCSVTASYSLLLELLQHFRPLYPRIDVVVETGDAAYAIEKVQQDDADIAIAPRPDTLPSNIEFLEFSRSPLMFIGPVISCPVSEQLGASPISWETVPFIVAEHGLARQRLYEWFRQRTLQPTVYAQVGGHEAIVSMVALGFGVGVVPELVLTNSPMREQVQVLPVTPALAPFEIGLCALRRRLQDPVVDAFWRMRHSPS
ncbi:HTH-type transcriptional activator IlvY [Salinispirillum marinum]|uniref:HTH-type transcriptional activator IlvY n=2 Tax=Saccharospirillaceae TaxID=255527 RepID=A0ABV8BKY4_9GAMM